MSVEDLSAVCGEKNPAGLKRKVYGICECDIATIPAMKTTTGVGDSITIDGNITLEAGKKWAEIDVIPDTGEVTHTSAGVRSGKGFTNKFDFKLEKSIGSDEWMNKNVNGCMVFLVEEKTGKFRLIGNKEVPASFDAAEGKTGSTIDSEKSWICSVMDTTGEVAPYYEGTIDLTA